MIIEIRLKNSKYCDNCPCVGWTDIGNEKWCDAPDMNADLTETFCEEDEEHHLLRPIECIEKHGE